MRMTFKVASAGSGCIFRYPDLPEEATVKTGGIFDYDKCAKMLAVLQDAGYALGSSGDGRNAVIAASAFLYNLKECAERMIAKAAERRQNGDKNAPHAFENSPSDKRATKKLDEGRGAFVRVDIKDAWPIRMRVSWHNPSGGDMQNVWCEDVALLCVEVADAMGEKSGGKVRPVEGVGCAGMIARAREIETKGE